MSSVDKYTNVLDDKKRGSGHDAIVGEEIIDNWEGYNKWWDAQTYWEDYNKWGGCWRYWQGSQAYWEDYKKLEGWKRYWKIGIYDTGSGHNP